MYKWYERGSFLINVIFLTRFTILTPKCKFKTQTDEKPLEKSRVKRSQGDDLERPADSENRESSQLVDDLRTAVFQ